MSQSRKQWYVAMLETQQSKKFFKNYLQNESLYLTFDRTNARDNLLNSAWRYLESIDYV